MFHSGTVYNFPLAHNLLTPTKWNSSWSIRTLFHQGLVELASWSGMDLSPAMLAVVLEAGYVSTEEWSKLATAPCSLTLITHLVI
jgi:hypothetical protein